MRYQPHDYQERAKKFIIDHNACGLFLEMGLGKTVITLTAIDELLHDRFDVSKVLVIAPLRVAEDTWSRESKKWDHLKHIKIAKILGDAATRKAALKQEADIYVVNRENVVWLINYLETERIKWPFDMVVIDELSSFKSNQAKRFKALRRMRPMMERIVGLTGTPAANSLMDLWAEMYLLDRGERLGRTLTAYRGNWFTPGYGNGYVTYKWTPRRGALEDITKRISDITVSMKAEDYLTLPDKIESTVEVHLDKTAEKAYREMEHESLLELEGDEIAALDAAAVMSKLLQLANGFVYNASHEGIYIHKAKLDALDEIVEAADGSPVLVFYSFQADRIAIMEHFPDARVLEDDSTIEDWNKGNIKILLAHPASAGYGLNLQDGGHIMAWYGLPWSLEQYTQAVARLQRQGQKYPVMIYHIIAAGTVDEQVVKSLAKKDMTQGALLNALKERRSKN
jgi:SNF2 family DNA or RNA helicase